jgi:hypothetical protein
VGPDLHRDDVEWRQTDVAENDTEKHFSGKRRGTGIEPRDALSARKGPTVVPLKVNRWARPVGCSGDGDKRWP